MQGDQGGAPYFRLLSIALAKRLETTLLLQAKHSFECSDLVPEGAWWGLGWPPGDPNQLKLIEPQSPSAMGISPELWLHGYQGI